MPAFVLAVPERARPAGAGSAVAAILATEGYGPSTTDQEPVGQKNLGSWSLHHQEIRQSLSEDEAGFRWVVTVSHVLHGNLA